MQNLSKFQLVLMLILGAFIFIGTILFALSGRGDSDIVTKITIWGTMKSSTFKQILDESALNKDETIKITYVEYPEESFDQQFIEALAADRGPDMVLLPQDAILRHEDKIVPVPYKTFPERDFKDAFIEESELFLVPQGILAFPFTVDPMVMYWNRDTFTNAALPNPPRFWSEFYALSDKLTVKDTALNISKSAVALGEFSNITNSSELLSLLIMQAGSPITLREGNKVQNVMNEQLGFPVRPADKAVTFFTEFSNPLKTFYSWNRSLRESKNMFLAGDLAVYFGFASELGDIRAKNPNLNFDVAAMPQIQGVERKSTFGKMSGLAVMKASKNNGGAYRAAVLLSGATGQKGMASVTNLPPVRRDLLAEVQGEAYKTVFYESAIQSKAWLSPRMSTVAPIFEEMIESITGGRALPSAAIGKASNQLNSLLGI